MHVGFWGMALIVVVVVSWIMYRYLAPEGWKEWTRAGILQAFIIAFYAEMYGFPLTIYFLARYFGIDLAWTEGGNLWAQLFGTPIAHLVAMLIGYVIVFAGAGLIADGWRRIHKGRREQKLVTDGVYARMRHPQYTGLFLIVFGEGIVHWPTLVSVIAFPIIVVSYTWLARKEERQMLERFGKEYRDYRRRVPMFIPASWRINS
ncbi:MAG TPA: isoprenylcysteine carboxylmethyltransferase family protein [Acidobacteriota bacterium]|nr:isoprenylcysteine carboxylmethyltransferase family protein [Acidobacteriota bacterium]